MEHLYIWNYILWKLDSSETLSFLTLVCALFGPQIPPNPKARAGQRNGYPVMVCLDTGLYHAFSRVLRVSLAGCVHHGQYYTVANMVSGPEKYTFQCVWSPSERCPY